jgi:hypothetical protein
MLGSPRAPGHPGAMSPFPWRADDEWAMALSPPLVIAAEHSGMVEPVRARTTLRGRRS